MTLAEVDQADRAPLLRRVVYEHPGVTVIQFADFDIGIDACDDPDHAHRCTGLRVFIYPNPDGYYGSTGDVPGSFTLHGTTNERGYGGDPLEPQNPRMEGPHLHAIESVHNRTMLDFRNGAAVLVLPGHVFGYWINDGGACVAIVHTRPTSTDCEDYGCDQSLVTDSQSAGVV